MRRALTTFLCQKLDDGTPILQADLSIVCDGPDYLVAQLYSLIMIALFPVGTPCLYIYLLYKHRHTLHHLRREEERGEAEHIIHQTRRKSFIENVATRASGSLVGQEAPPVEDDALDDLAEHSENIKEKAHEEAVRVLPGYMVRIIGHYRMETYWFEIFECVRKVALIGLPIAFETGSILQQQFGLLVSFITFGCFLSFQPFIDPVDNQLEILCQLSIFVAMLMGLILRTNIDGLELQVASGVMCACALVPSIAIFILGSPLYQVVMERYSAYMETRMLNAIEKEKTRRTTRSSRRSQRTSSTSVFFAGPRSSHRSQRASSTSVFFAEPSTREINAAQGETPDRVRKLAEQARDPAECAKDSSTGVFFADPSVRESNGAQDDTSQDETSDRVRKLAEQAREAAKRAKEEHKQAKEAAEEAVKSMEERLKEVKQEHRESTEPDLSDRLKALFFSSPTVARV